MPLAGLCGTLPGWFGSSSKVTTAGTNVSQACGITTNTAGGLLSLKAAAGASWPSGLSGWVAGTDPCVSGAVWQVRTPVTCVCSLLGSLWLTSFACFVCWWKLTDVLPSCSYLAGPDVRGADAALHRSRGQSRSTRSGRGWHATCRRFYARDACDGAAARQRQRLVRDAPGRMGGRRRPARSAVARPLLPNSADRDAAGRLVPAGRVDAPWAGWRFRSSGQCSCQLGYRHVSYGVERHRHYVGVRSVRPSGRLADHQGASRCGLPD